MSLHIDTRASIPVSDARPVRLRSAGGTDKGGVRSANEDRFGIFPELGLFVLADGMGGHASGEIAAEWAVDRVYRVLADPDTTWPPEHEAPLGMERGLLVGAIERANHVIHAASMRPGDHAGMGTTIVAALAVRSQLVLAHVGDSRIYRLRGGRLEALTEDHSLFNELIRKGLADPDRPEYFAHRNVITRSLGPEPTVEVDVRDVDLEPGDTYLLCSDGLHGPVPPNEIRGILGGPDLHAAVRHLLERANAHGGPDNVTAIVVRAESGSP